MEKTERLLDLVALFLDANHPVTLDEVKDALSCNCTTDPVRGAPFALLAMFLIGGWRIRRAAR